MSSPSLSNTPSRFSISGLLILTAVVGCLLVAWQTLGQPVGASELVFFVMVLGAGTGSAFFRWIPTWLLGLVIGGLLSLMSFSLPMMLRIQLVAFTTVTFAFGGVAAKLARWFPRQRWPWVGGYLLCFLIGMLFTPSDLLSMLVVSTPLACCYWWVARHAAKYPFRLWISGPLLMVLGVAGPLTLLASMQGADSDVALPLSRLGSSLSWMELSLALGAPLFLLGTVALGLAVVRIFAPEPAPPPEPEPGLLRRWWSRRRRRREVVKEEQDARKDAEEKDVVVKDAVEKDAEEKDALEKDAVEKDVVVKENDARPTASEESVTGEA